MGDADQGIRVGVDQFFRGRPWSAAEPGHRLLKLYVGVFSSGLVLNNQSRISGWANRNHPNLVGGVQMNIEPRAAAVVVAGLETKGMDEVQLRVVETQRRPCCRCFASGLMQNDVVRWSPDE